MKLKSLFKNIQVQQIKGSVNLDITGLCSDSKRIAPGNLFIARKGIVHNGVKYIPEAIAAGAVAILTDLYDPLINKNITQIIHPDVAGIEGIVAAEYYHNASQELCMVGITGTNGKTTTSFLVKHLLDNLEGPCGLIGTIEYVIGKHRYQAVRTTPDVVSTHKMLRDMVDQKCHAAIMEVTSHALDQKRVDQMDFDIAVFTNLSLDHLDYHHTMENYARAKSKLFKSLDASKIKKNHPYPKSAIINIDSPWAEQIMDGCRAKILSYGLNPKADLSAEDVCLLPIGTTLKLSYQGKKVPLKYSLTGRFNVYNCLAAAAVGLSRGHSLEKIAEVLASAPYVQGRLEAVPNPLGLKIYVDFAHTDDALLNVLECLHEFKTGRIITVVGCGGNRDATKRPKMARAAEKLSDIVIVTSDNPRNEDPQAIAREMISGLQKSDSHFVELDRNLAIKKAIDLASQEDTILIAGKGHEAYQIFAHHTIEFDDRKVALYHAEAKFLQHQGCPVL